MSALDAAKQKLLNDERDKFDTVAAPAAPAPRARISSVASRTKPVPCVISFLSVKPPASDIERDAPMVKTKPTSLMFRIR